MSDLRRLRTWTGLTVALAAAGLLFAPRVAFTVDAPAYTVATTTAGRAALLGADETAWTAASAIAWGPAPYETRFRALWSPAGLFLRFDADDASPWHTMSRRDEHLWEEEVVEIFLDPDRSGRDYYELEVNPANVVCDLLMITPTPWKGDFDWNLAGLETRAHTLKNAAGRTTGWTATAFLPWSGLQPLPSARKVAVPPKAGDRWRFNVFRIERPGGPTAPERDAISAAWSPPSGESFHEPGAFRDLVFAFPAK
jgi:hypothetical protein